MLGQAAQDYLKTIYKLQRRGGKVQTSALAGALGVQDASVTNMVKKLADLGLLAHTPYYGVALTPAGRRAALEIIRHHRLIELYLQQALGYTWDEVDAEAERLEHHISEEFEDRIDRMLGYPTTDPHGDPIPRKDGEVDDVEHTRLTDLQPGEVAVIRRVSDRDPAFLRYLASLGLYPGVTITLRERAPFRGPLFVLVGETEHALGVDAAGHIGVERDSGLKRFS
ncbi:MAG: metal-dependent transcriptional regulator [Chloroflexi bacterium]|nr:metal-dependent transcriptional regulator [Chloroflexota bacterium]